MTPRPSLVRSLPYLLDAVKECLKKTLREKNRLETQPRKCYRPFTFIFTKGHKTLDNYRLMTRTPPSTPFGDRSGGQAVFMSIGSEGEPQTLTPFTHPDRGIGHPRQD